MGKLKDNYEKKKPTRRQQNKIKKSLNEDNHCEYMCSFLKTKWNVNSIHYQCTHCLQIAYESEMNGGDRGYITDEELIACSNGKMQCK